ncbi:RHS repeat-associated core domain-containing protein [Vandammella animalimorsus]|nr:RHS repeat-associated core domain-containing protein [Vandammella animalimorsus]
MPAWAQAQQSTRLVSLPNQDYTESTEDLVVKVLGGHVVINRTWTWGRWYLNDTWADLILQPDPMGGVLAINRADRIYTRLGAQSGTSSADSSSNGVNGHAPSIPPARSSSAGSGGGDSGISIGSDATCAGGIDTSAIADGSIYSFDENNYITRAGSGWQWYDREGNTIDYDDMGRMLSYANAAGVKTTLVRDGQGRITGVRDHRGQQVITVQYGGASGQPTRITDNTGRSLRYEWSLPAAAQPPGGSGPAGGSTPNPQPNTSPNTSPNGSIGLAMLTKVTDTRGGVWSYTYTSAGYIHTRTDPEGGKIEISYMTQPPRQEAAKPASGAGTGAGADTGSGSAGTGGSGGSGISFDANICGGVSGSTKVTLPQAIRVASVKNEVGAITNYRVDYDRVKREYHINIQLPGGATQYLRFDSKGRRLQNTLDGMDLMRVQRQSQTQDKITDARGQATIVQYDSAQARRPIKIIHPDGASETFAYDGIYNRKTRHVNTLGTVSTWAYDAKGNLIRWIEAQGKPEQRTTTYTYDAFGQMLSRTRGAGDGQGADAITERFEYDDKGNQTKVTDGENQSSTATYNVQGLPLTETNALGQTTTYAYDASGNLTRSANALNQSAQYNYDGRGRLTSITYPSGSSQTTSYDKAGQLTAVKDPLGHTTSLAYTPLGLPKELKQPSGATYSAEYTSQGRISRLTDPAGNVTGYRYGSKGEIFAGLHTATVYPTYTETYGYNQRDICTKVTQAIGTANSPTLLESYDALGQRISSTDPLGHTTQYQWDALGRLTQVTDALGGITRQTWDAHDNLLSVTDAKGNTHQFQYDKAGRQIKETRPLGGSIQTAWDAAGRLSQRTDAAGNQTHYHYDAADNLIRKQSKFANGSIDETTVFTYNADGELTAYEQKDGAGQLISKARYQLDALGRRTQTELTYAKADGSSFTHTLGQSYNADGQLQSQQYPDGSEQSFSYDQGQLSQIQLPDQSQIRIDSYDWLFPKQISAPGAVITQTADALQRFAAIEVKSSGNTPQSLLKRSYQYDAVGNITQIDSDQGKTNYAYDRLQRLTHAQPDDALQTLGLPVEQYSYDAAGNRTSSAHQPGSWLYNADNQLTQYPRSINPQLPGSATEQTRLSYTAQGHTESESSPSWQRNYRYNAAERLIEITQGSTAAVSSGTALTVRYRYDPFGRRIAKTVTNGQSSQTTYFLNGDSALLAEADEAGQITKAYGFNPNTHDAEEELWSTDPLWQADIHNGSLTSSQTLYHYITTDHLGTPILATDKSGNKTWRGYSEAFGNTGIEAGSSTQINLRFPGQYWDKETGLHQNFFRDYSPARGRYVQSDPIGLDGGINLYVYSHNQPVIFYDDDGLFVFVPALIGGAVGALSDLGFQMFMNGGRFDCINWVQVGISGAVGAVGGAWMGGAFRHSISGKKWLDASHKWKSVRARYGKAHNLPPGKDVHHWLIPQGSRIARKYPGLVNHPWNLNPLVPNSINRGRFNQIGWLQMVIEGSPGWARVTAGFAAGGALGETFDDDCTSCN